MIPYFKFGILGIDAPITSAIRRVFGTTQEVIDLSDAHETEQFLSGVSLPEWRLLIAHCQSLKKSQSLLRSLKEVYLRLSTFHLVLWSDADGYDELISQLMPLENVHVIRAAPYEPIDELEHHFHNIKTSLDSYWLYAKASDILRLYEDCFIGEGEPSSRILRFLESAALLIPARSVNIFVLGLSGDVFEHEAGTKSSPLQSVRATTINDLFEFSDACLTFTVHKGDEEKIVGQPALGVGDKLFISTFRHEGIPAFILYSFESCLNPGLVRALCHITSREIFHLYRSTMLRSQHATLKAISEIDGLDAQKREVLHKILFHLKSYFRADDVAILELTIGEDGEPRFEKTYVERAKKGVEPLPFRGFAQHCVANKRALLITETFGGSEKPFGIGFEFDPDRLEVGHAKKVKINTFRAPHASEDEKSLMYFPLRRGQLSGAIKIGSFVQSNAFDLKHLRSLSLFAETAGCLLGNIHAVGKLRTEIDRHTAQKEMLQIAEVLFFYREITLGIFHQVRNHLDSINSEMLIVEMKTHGKGDKSSPIGEYLKEAKIQIRLGKELIDKAQQRGLTLNPIEQDCELVRDVIRPAIEYARQRVRTTNIEIEHSLSSERYETILDIDLAKESIINLLNNAIWAVKSNHSSKKRIFIAVRKTPDKQYARVEIDDSGIGIVPEDFKKLFTPGFTTRSEGTGFGLFFTRRLMEHFGGACHVVKSVPNKGTTVEVLIPVMETN